jgi:outer membrane protein OmpA-like peptidoglycan-associated protein
MPAGLDQEGDAKLQQGDQRGGVPLMWFAGKRRGLGLLAVVAVAFACPTQPAPAQTAAPAANLVDQLAGPETPANIDLVALRQQAADRIQSRADATALRRPPIAPQLLKLPQFDFNVVFDPDTSVIRPQSYQVIGRIADALSDPKLLPYAFLVINHSESTGARAANLTLSQRRADAIRAVLAGSFKISPRRLQTLGLGEEQLQDSSRPTSPANARAQLVAIGNVPAAVANQPAAGSVPPAKKGPATKSKKRQ